MNVKGIAGVTVAALAIALGAVTSSHAAPPPTLRYAKSIEIPSQAKEELIAVSLDSDAFAATNDGLTDLRILNSAGNEVAFVVRRAAGMVNEKFRTTWTSQKPRVKLLDDDGLEIIVQLDDKDPKPHGLRLVTPLVNFEQRVRVDTSPDGQTWTPSQQDGVIFDYSQFMDVRNDTLELPPGNESGQDAKPPRYFRIVIDDVTQEQQSQLLELTRRLRGDRETDRSERVTIRRQPFRIDRIEFWNNGVRQRAAGNRLVGYTIDAAPASPAAASNQTIVRLTTRRQPITILRLAINDRNFSRAVHVEGEQTGENPVSWQSIGGSTISRIDFRELRREHLAIAIPETRQSNLRIIIDNRDSPPLEITGVTARGTEYEAVFLAVPTESYRLAYGNPALGPATYDTETISASLAAHYTPVTAMLGEQTILSLEPTASASPFLARVLDSPTFLIVVVALFAILLAIGLYRATRRLDDLPP